MGPLSTSVQWSSHRRHTTNWIRLSSIMIHKSSPTSHDKRWAGHCYVFSFCYRLRRRQANKRKLFKPPVWSRLLSNNDRVPKQKAASCQSECSHKNRKFLFDSNFLDFKRNWRMVYYLPFCRRESIEKWEFSIPNKYLQIVKGVDSLLSQESNTFATSFTLVLFRLN